MDADRVNAMLATIPGLGFKAPESSVTFSAKIDPKSMMVESTNEALRKITNNTLGVLESKKEISETDKSYFENLGPDKMEKLRRSLEEIVGDANYVLQDIKNLSRLAQDADMDGFGDVSDLLKKRLSVIEKELNLISDIQRGQKE